MWAKNTNTGFTIIELLVVIVVIGILASVALVSFSGAQAKARDSSRISKITAIAKALEMYKLDNNQYPPIQDGRGWETTCGSQTENWGHCDRNKILADSLAPYMRIDPTSLSDATQGAYYYHYTSQSTNGYQTYGMMVPLEGNGGVNDGGYYTNAYEIGPKPAYCMAKYSGTGASWHTYTTQCSGGD